MSSTVIRMGDTITYIRHGIAATAKVVAIDHCPRRRDMFGVKVAEIAWEQRDFAFLTLDNGSYCYGSEVTR